MIECQRGRGSNDSSEMFIILARVRRGACRCSPELGRGWEVGARWQRGRGMDAGYRVNKMGCSLLLCFPALILRSHWWFQAVQSGKRYSVSGVCIVIAIDHGFQWLKRHLKHFRWLRNYFPRHVCMKADAFHKEIQISFILSHHAVAISKELSGGNYLKRWFWKEHEEKLPIPPQDADARGRCLACALQQGEHKGLQKPENLQF